MTSTFPRWEGDPGPGFVFELSRRLSNRFEITVLAPHGPGLKLTESWDGLTIRRFRYAPEALETLAYGSGIQAELHTHAWKYGLVPFFLIAQWWAARRLLRGERYAAIHAHWVFPQGLIALLSGNAPVIVTAHGSDLNSLKGWLFRKILGHVLGHARVVTVVSAAMAATARSLCRSMDNLRVLPMGVDLHNRFSPSTEAREPATFLFVGRLLDSKGVDTLIEAFSTFGQRLPEARLVVIGNGPRKEAYRARARALGIADRISFLGALPGEQLPAWYRRATALICPSRAEGLGLVVVEAAGCGCPIIASDIPSLREIVVDGVSALLHPPGNAQALGAAMNLLAQDRELAGKLGQSARAGVAARYDWAAAARGYEAAIESALAPRA